ncbi:MAG: antitoxin [Ardenticatenaceae bacterium]|nr:MAG: antitoxin [Ardenticatenaceae bacterium]
MSATEARIHFGELMRHVTEQNEPVFVERAGKPQVVVISVAEYENLLAQRASNNWQDTFYKITELSQTIKERREGVPLADPVEIIQEMREERSDHIQRLLP